MNLIDDYFCLHIIEDWHREHYKKDIITGDYSSSKFYSYTYDIDIVAKEWCISDDKLFSSIFSAYIAISWILAADDVYGVLA